MPALRDLSQRWSVWVAGLAALATGAVLLNQPGEYMIDNRFEQYWNPGRRIARTFTIWDGSRGLGWVREEFWPGATVPIGLFRYLGASPGLAEHLWHATLLTAAGAGCVALLRCYRPTLGWEHLLAALAYMFGPFAATFLLPSNLFIHHALTPWLAVALHRGLVEERPWRSVATFALLVGLAGNLDTPGLLYAVVPLTLVFLYDLLVDRRTTVRRALGWLWRALVLTMGVSAAALAKTVIGAEALTQRLGSTESPEVVALASSWAESWRGLGFWVSYMRDASGPVRPSVRPYVTSWWVVLLTFAPAVIGIGALWWNRRRREALLFGAIAVAGVFLMVGPHPADDPSPWGRGWLWTLHNVTTAAAVRSTYKAGIAATLGLAILFGLGAVALFARTKTAGVRAALGGSLALVVLAGAVPFWTGELYHPESRVSEVPDYWTDAMAWLDEQPGDSQVMFLPGATRSVYRWGWTGDDIHDALMDRAHLTDTAITVSPPIVADLLFAIDDAAADPGYSPGTLAPAFRRLGIGYVVLRNDLDWRLMGVARPAAFDGLRDDPDFERVARFGPPDPVEAGLPPVEVYALKDPAPRARAIGDQPWILYSGSGAGWVSMGAEGLLDGDAPAAPTATQDTEELIAQLERGGQLVITDTNRRTAPAVYTFSEERSQLLAAGEELADRPAVDLYARAGSQTVATFGDATNIDDPGLFRTLAGFLPHFRPSRAFDGDLTTGWVVQSSEEPRRRSLRVELAEPQVIDHLEVTAFDSRAPERSAGRAPDFRGVPRIGRFAVDFSDGTTVYGNLLPGRAVLDFPARSTSSLVLRVLDVSAAAEVGIAEVDVPGLDLVERVRMPDDVFRAAEGSVALREQVEEAPVTYLLTRARAYSALGGADIETQMLRQLRTVGERRYEVAGTLNAPAGSVGAGDGDCADVGLEIDGKPVTVRWTNDGTTEFEACDPLTLGPGWHEVTSAGLVPVDRLSLSAGTPAPESRGRPALESVEVDSTTQRLTVDAPDGGWVLPGIGFDERWRGAVDGADVGAPELLDGQVSWFVPPADDPTVLSAEFAPVRIWRWSLIVTALSVVAALAILLRPRRRR